MQRDIAAYLKNSAVSQNEGLISDDVFCRRGMYMDFEVMALPLRNRIPDTVARRPSHAVVVSESGKNPMLTAAVLRKFYDFTVVEANLCVALASTYNLGSAANLCGISVNNAKTRLKVIFSKAGVSSQAELLVRLNRCTSILN